MKKIMFALALLAAVAVQGAAITWSVANGTISLPTGSSYSSKQGVMVYLIDASAKDSIIEAIGGGSFTASTEGVLDASATSNTKGAVASHEVSTSALTAGTSYNFAMLIVDTVAGAPYYNVSATMNATAYTPGVDEAAKIAFGSTQFNAGSGWTQAPGGDIPEPTSGILLLVGGAMLALRRKQK